MKRTVSLFLCLLIMLSTLTFNATAIEKNTKFRLAFEDDLDGFGASTMEWWDPSGKLGSLGKNGSVAFFENKLSIAKNSRISLITATGSEEAANFRDGIIEFDITWNESSKDSSAALCLEFYDSNTNEQIEVLQIYSHRVTATNAGKSVDLTSGVLGVAKPGFEFGKTYSIKIYMVKNHSSQNKKQAAYSYNPKISYNPAAHVEHGLFRAAFALFSLV